MRWIAPVLLILLACVPSASATPVCTDGYMGGPPASVCGGRIFPEALGSVAYVQYNADPTGFIEYQHGVEHLAKKYGRWVSTFQFKDRYGNAAVSAGADAKRPGEPGDSGDGRSIQVIKITDHKVPDAGKRTFVYSLSVHGNERGGLEGGLRTAEDLAIAATNGGTVVDGIDNYTSTTGRKPEFHSYEARDLLAKQVVYLVDFNVDGWAAGDLWAAPLPLLYTRGNSIGTDLNRQMPSIGRINTSRTPLQEAEARFGHRFMHDVAAAGRGGLMDYGADIHGELTSQAYVDVMYPAGQFDSVDHRRLMAIAERTKSVIDVTLYGGIVDQLEQATIGNEDEAPQNFIPQRPAHWATVWDTLGYTDTGFIGDYMATDLGVTGMDYEIAFNHTVPEKVWNVYLQENHINATRAIIRTSMAYGLTQDTEFSDSSVRVEPGGRAGYVVNPDKVTDADGAGTKPGPDKSGKGADGKAVDQRAYNVTNQQWFEDTNRLMPKPFVRIAAADIAMKAGWLDAVDTLVLADMPAPRDAKGREYDRGAYFANVKAWVERGGNLVLTDRALHALADLGVVAKDAIHDVRVYQPYANFADLGHPLAQGLRANARQLVEAAILGYEIGNDASPMTVVATSAWTGAEGAVIGTTGNGAGDGDDGSQTSVGEVVLGKGKVRILGGALPSPTETNDHRYGLRDYALTYTGLYLMENAIKHDVAGLGEKELPADVAPAARRCVANRTLTLKLPQRARGSRVRSAVVRVAGKRVKVRRVKGRLTARINLRGQRGRPITVTTVLRTASGKRITQTRRYRLCPAKRKA